MSRMKSIDFYLAVSSSGRIRVLKQSPALERNEIAIRLRLELPKTLFEQPVLQAKVRIDEEAVRPVEISPEVLISTQDLIRRETGFQVELVPLPLPEEVRAPDPQQEEDGSRLKIEGRHERL